MPGMSGSRCSLTRKSSVPGASKMMKSCQQINLFTFDNQLISNFQSTRSTTVHTNIMSYSRLEDDEASLVLADLSMDDDSFGEVPVRSHHTHSRSTSNSTSEAWSRSRPVSGSSAHTGLSTDSLGTTINSFPVPPVPAAHHGAGRAPKPPRFSIFAAPPAAASSRGIGLGHPSASAAEEERSEVHEDEDHEDTHHEEQKEEGHEQNDEQEPGEEVESPAIREERLRASLAELKKFSAVFEGFHHALKDARAHNEVCSLNL